MFLASSLKLSKYYYSELLYSSAWITHSKKLSDSCGGLGDGGVNVILERFCKVVLPGFFTTVWDSITDVLDRNQTVSKKSFGRSCRLVVIVIAWWNVVELMKVDLKEFFFKVVFSCHHWSCSYFAFNSDTLYGGCHGTRSSVWRLSGRLGFYSWGLRRR